MPGTKNHARALSKAIGGVLDALSLAPKTRSQTESPPHFVFVEKVSPWCVVACVREGDGLSYFWQATPGETPAMDRRHHACQAQPGSMFQTDIVQLAWSMSISDLALT